MTLSVEEAAARLEAARAGRRTLTRFSDEHPGLDETWGYAVQDADRAARLARGERPTGAKLGLTSEAKQRTMGVHQPIVGFLTDAMDAASGLDVGHLAQPRVEPEVAFVLGRDLDRAIDADEVPAYVSGVAAALEVLDSRWTGYSFRLPDVLADDTSAAGYLVGEPVALPGDLAGRRARFLVDGVEVAVATPAAILGDPALALVHLAAHLARRAEVLPAGSVVLAGAMTDAVPLERGAEFAVEVDGLPPVTLRR